MRLCGYAELKGLAAAIGEAGPGKSRTQYEASLIRGKSAGRPEAAGLPGGGDALGCVQPI